MSTNHQQIINPCRSMSESAAQDRRLMAPTQLGKDPECSVEQKLREVGVSESSGGTPLVVAFPQ